MSSKLMSNSSIVGGVGLNGKKSQDLESNTKIIRELTHLQANRYCFDCGQRGPTYINITIGSFICMTCSGLLRGLTPPHRVKSISMASFTADEIDLLKSRGNEYCKRVWLATYNSGKDGNLGSDNNPDRVNILKNFLVTKYEQKRFYLDPSKLSKYELAEIQETAARALSQASSTSTQKSPSLSSLSSSTSNPSPLLNTQRNKSPNLNNNNNNINSMSLNNSSNRLVNSVTLPDIKPLSSLFDNSASALFDAQFGKTTFQNQNNFVDQFNSSNLKPQEHQLNNLNGLVPSSSPWANLSNGDSGNNSGDSSNFADFENAFDAFSTPTTFQAKFDQPALIATSTTTSSTSSSTNNAFSTAMQQPILPGPQNNQKNPSTLLLLQQSQNNQNNPPSSEDKYAALKDLDDIFKSPSMNDDENDLKSNNTNGGGLTDAGLPNSVSLPAHLSTGGGPPNSNNGWFSSTSPNQNPFSQITSSPPTQQQGINSMMKGGGGGWNANSNGNSNPNNPFFTNNNSWQSPSAAPAPMSNNNFMNMAYLPPSHQVNNISQQQQQPSLFSQPPQLLTNNHAGHFMTGGSTGGSVGGGDKTFNPFFSAQTQTSTGGVLKTSNPNNPFL